jgi:hypothetical protein
MERLHRIHEDLGEPAEQLTVLGVSRNAERERPVVKLASTPK